MGLSINTVENVKAAHEELLLLDKVLEGCLLLLSIYKEIRLMLVDDSGTSVILVKGLVSTDSNTIDIVEYHQEIRFEDSLPLNRTYKGNMVDFSRDSNIPGDILIPINNNNFEIIAFLALSSRPDEKGSVIDYVKILKEQSSNKSIRSFYSRFIPDAMMFMKASGEIFELNHIAAEINSSEPNFFQYIHSNPPKKLELGQLQHMGICFCSNILLEQFELAAIFIPIYSSTLEGHLAILSDMTLIRQKDKELMGKSAVIKEIHHRVKNNLQTITSLLRLQMRRVNSPVLQKSFYASINRISSIALIHEALSKDGLDRVNVKYAFGNILEMILATMVVEPQKVIKGEIRGRDLILDSNKASNLSLCITELVQNAIEHAFIYRKNGTITITIDSDDNEFIIRVEDDGVGMTTKKSRGNSLGLNVVRLITTENLKGTFIIDACSTGTVAEIRFPVQ